MRKMASQSVVRAPRAMMGYYVGLVRDNRAREGVHLAFCIQHALQCYGYVLSVERKLEVVVLL